MLLYQKPRNNAGKFCLCEIVAVGSGLLPNSQVADSKYSKSYKGNCKANHLENKYCIGTQHTADHSPKALQRECSIKVEPLWTEYKSQVQFRCPTTLFLPVSLAFLILHKYVWVGVQHVHMHIHAFLWSVICRTVLSPTFERYAHTLYLIYTCICGDASCAIHLFFHCPHTDMHKSEIL